MPAPSSAHTLLCLITTSPRCSHLATASGRHAVHALTPFNSPCSAPLAPSNQPPSATPTQCRPSPSHPFPVPLVQSVPFLDESLATRHCHMYDATPRSVPSASNSGPSTIRRLFSTCLILHLPRVKSCHTDDGSTARTHAMSIPSAHLSALPDFVPFRRSV